MGDFAAAWLSLREPVDVRARARALVDRLRQALPRADGIHILDLGCGTGSNLRVLAPQLGGTQHWLCVDADPALLAVLPDATARWARGVGLGWEPDARRISRVAPPLSVTLEPRALDLAQALDQLPCERLGLISASALIDLVSADWLAALVALAAEHHLPMLVALSYDGRVKLEPRLDLDAEVIGWVNAHHGRDKGFGPALGPAATETLAALARSHGYQVETCPSDWLIGPSEPELQRALIHGWCDAASEQAPDRSAMIVSWRERRLDAVTRGASRLRVGHLDLLALP